MKVASMIKDVLVVAGVVAALFAVITTSAYLFQRKLIYFPDQSVPDIPPPFTLVSYTSSDGLTLGSWYAAPRDPGALVIVYFQGNGGHVGRRDSKLIPYLEAGMGALLVGYRGYGGNPGSPTEAGLYDDAMSALHWLAGQGIAADRIVLYGESLGTGVAVELATRVQSRAVVLEAPFPSLVDAGARAYPYLPVRWLVHDRYDSLAKIGTLSAPVMVLHGTADDIVPVAMGEAILAAAPEPKRGLFFPGFGHNELIAVGAPEEILAWLANLKN